MCPPGSSMISQRFAADSTFARSRRRRGHAAEAAAKLPVPSVEEPVHDPCGNRPWHTSATLDEQLIGYRTAAIGLRLDRALVAPSALQPRRRVLNSVTATSRRACRSNGKTPNASSQLLPATPCTLAAGRDARSPSSCGRVMRTHGRSSAFTPSMLDASAHTTCARESACCAVELEPGRPPHR
jgi:hypothetical protein